ncbi:MAG TPA: class I SAM-dependent methyltransferase [Rhizomicrobium sp.]|nr:class I SAM-dependent methyltransferase [Rhizomicrobium sp.]
MDKVYRRQRYLYDFTRKYYLLGRDRLIRDLALAPGERLVEIGCGTGRNLVAIARAYPQAHLFGLDASAQMLKTAALQVRRAGLSHRITLVQGLAEQLSPAIFGQDAFEHALFSYSLSMIPDWRGALAAARAALAPEGQLHVVDFGDLAGLPVPVRRMLEGWLKAFHVTPRVELLAEIERGVRQNGQFRVLPGRYAFAFSDRRM